MWHMTALTGELAQTRAAKESAEAITLLERNLAGNQYSSQSSLANNHAILA